MIIDPQVIYDLPEEEYHSHPALSQSGAKLLLPPYCPAIFAWQREHPREPSEAMDHGKAAHRLSLGIGGQVRVIDADDWRKPATRAIRAEVRAAGGTAILRKDFLKVTRMRQALRRTPIVGQLFDPEHGDPEVTLLWHDDEFDIDLRARLDWLPHIIEGRRLIIPDYKTADSADPSAFARQAARFGYHQQDPWYRDGVAACLGVEDAAFVFVVQSKEPPYLVTTFEWIPSAVEVGRAKNRAARERFRDCTAAGVWPSYASEIVALELPPWADRDW